MNFVLMLLGIIVGTFVLRAPLRKAPGLFYLLAVAVDVAYVLAARGVLPRAVFSALSLPIGKCMLSLALFVVVMYIGVFPQGSRVHQLLKPVRSELSILACILTGGHMAMYLASYAPQLGMGMSGNVMGALAVALVLLVLLPVLGTTSFGVIKRHMSSDGWKRLQRWAYVFFGLVYIHLLLMLAPSAIRGGQTALASVAVYSVIFLGYAAFRLWRACADRRAAACSDVVTRAHCDKSSASPADSWCEMSVLSAGADGLDDDVFEVLT